MYGLEAASKDQRSLLLFLPHLQLRTSSLEVLPLVLFERVQPCIHIGFQNAREKCDFTFHLGFLGVIPWLE